MPGWLSSMFGGDYYSDGYSDRRRRVIYTDGGYHGSRYSTLPSRLPVPITTHRQVCSACGKYRSPSWCARNPVRYGEIPISNICRRCADKSTSSEESRHHLRRRRRHHHHRDSYVDGSYDTYASLESRYDYPRHRHRSDSLGYIRPRSLARSPSADRVNIVIQNDAREPRARIRTMSSSDDVVRVSRRVSVDRLPRRRYVRSVSSSPVLTEDVVEDYLPMRRPLSRTRARSRSNVHFVDELDEPHYHHRPRSLSRGSYVQEVAAPRRRGYSRHRPIFVDGPAETQTGFASSSPPNSGEEPVEEIMASRPRSFQHVRPSSFFNGTRDNPTESSGESQANGKDGPKAQADDEEKITSPEPTEKLKMPERQYGSSSAATKIHPAIATDETYHASKSSRSTTRASDYAPSEQRFQPSSHAFGDPSDSSDVPSRSRDPADLNNWARRVYASCDWEVDSEFPSPPHVTFAVPTSARSRSPSPLRFPMTAISGRPTYSRRGQRSTYPITPADSYDGVGSPSSYASVNWHNHHHDGKSSPVDCNEVVPSSMPTQPRDQGRSHHYTDPVYSPERNEGGRDSAPYSTYGRNRRHHAPPSPADSYDGVHSPVPLQSSYERTHHYSDHSSPADSNEGYYEHVTPIVSYEGRYDLSNPNASNDRRYGAPNAAGDSEGAHRPPHLATPAPLMTMTPENSDHPDHIAYMLSTAQITPSHDRPGVYEYANKSRAYGAQSYDTPPLTPVTPMHNRGPRYCQHGPSHSYANYQHAQSHGHASPSAYYGTAFVSMEARGMDGQADEAGEEADEEFHYGDRRAGAPADDINAISKVGAERDMFGKTPADYAAEGRAWMEQREREKAQAAPEAMFL